MEARSRRNHHHCYDRRALAGHYARPSLVLECCLILTRSLEVVGSCRARPKIEMRVNPFVVITTPSE